jgi:hypothetical protein
MNALKHGLDAQALLLPGEAEAEFHIRLDAWTAGHPPRDATEAALLARAVALSWRLDRADRACAEHLAERIRIAQSPERRQQRAAAATADTAAIGEQLLAGPPPPTYDLAKIHARLVRLRQGFWAPFRPIFDLPSTQARMAHKRLGKPIPPDDPAHPGRLLRRLRSTAAGCAWLLGRWTDLRAALEEGRTWTPEQRIAAVRLLAKLPAEALDDPRVETIYLGCCALGEADPLVFADQAREMADVELQSFLERMRGRGVRARWPRGREEARGRLLALVEGVIDELRSRSAVLAGRQEAAVATDRLWFDASPAGRRLRQWQSWLHGSLLRTLRLWSEAQRRPDEVIRRPKSTGKVGETSSAPENCGNARNEPNPDPPSGSGDESGVGWMHTTEGHGGGPLVGSHAAEGNPDDSVGASEAAASVCETARNEPTAGSPSRAGTSVPAPSADAMSG